MIHALLSLVFCIPAAFLGAPWPLLFWPASFYLGREAAQAEYRYIEAHGGKRAACPWWCGFLPSAWTAKGVLDWLLPLAACAACAVLRGLLRW